MITFAEIKKLWSEIEELLEEKAPHIKAQLNPGVSIEELELLEEYLDCELPLDFKFSLLVHNGSNDEFYGYNTLLSIELIRSYWDDMVDLFDNEDPWPDDPTSPRQFRHGNWDRKWIYIALATFIGDGFVMDMNPDVNGFHGQIFYRRNVHEKQYICCKSYYQFLHHYKKQLEEDKWDIENENVDIINNFLMYKEIK